MTCVRLTLGARKKCATALKRVANDAALAHTKLESTGVPLSVLSAGKMGWGWGRVGAGWGVGWGELPWHWWTLLQKGHQ
jgi:hypothetical protein